MSQIVTINGEQVQFILNNSEDLKVEGLDDNIIYSEGTRAILVNNTAQLIQSNLQTVVLQDEDLNQYYINEENGDILVTDEQESTINQTVENAEILHFVEDDTDPTSEPQIIYVNEDGYALNDTDLTQYQILEDEDGFLSPKTVKLETQVVDLDELINQESQSNIFEASTEANGYQYAILKDGKLHIQTYDGDILPIISMEDLPEEQSEVQTPENEPLELSQITGRNLLTGQTMTLHNYIDKLQKRIKTTETPKRLTEDGNLARKRRNATFVGLKGLLNKKLTLGKTTSGKRLVGKVIHVEKPSADRNEAENDEASLPTDVISSKDVENMQLRVLDENLDFDENDLKALSVEDFAMEPTEISVEKSPPSENGCKVLIQEKLVSKECFSHICRTLGGLMNMESVRKKLRYRNIVVKVVERKYEPETRAFSKNVSYCTGHMREEFLVDDEGEKIDNWSFVSDNSLQIGVLETGMEDEDERGYVETTNVTLIITYDQNNHRTIRVVLNNNPAIRCSLCDKEFRTNLQFKVHLINVHSQRHKDRSSKTCEVCNARFDDPTTLREHRTGHVDEGKLFQCPETECGRLFLTYRRLQRHGVAHRVPATPLECSICSNKYSTEASFQKHVLTHMKRNFGCDVCGKRFLHSGELNFHKRVHNPSKNYSCEICKRTFSRHSNLLRHIEIHKGSEELYRCTICGCSYHYMSSLTRHVVQNHVKRENAEAPPMLVETDCLDV